MSKAKCSFWYLAGWIRDKSCTRGHIHEQGLQLSKDKGDMKCSMEIIPEHMNSMSKNLTTIFIYVSKSPKWKKNSSVARPYLILKLKRRHTQNLHNQK